jgi:hypothetical protein
MSTILRRSEEKRTAKVCPDILFERADREPNELIGSGSRPLRLNFGRKSDEMTPTALRMKPLLSKRVEPV